MAKQYRMHGYGAHRHMADDMGQATLQEAIEENEKPNALSNPKVRRGLITAALFVIIAAGIWYYRHETFGKYQQSTDNAYIAADSVVVSSKVAGYVDHVFVTENQSVKEGDALAQLDVRDYRAQSNQVAAQIAATLAGADTFRAQQREQDAAIAQARAQLEAATVQALVLLSMQGM